ncbi:MAG TPA: Fic family protein [Candidatus Paceibacterota bacterium]|nr:Fic family protein [Candidatus Paceibacterota bacterium]
MEVQEVAFLARFVVESDAIEGIRNDPAEVRRRIEQRSRDDRSIPRGHLGAILMLRSAAGPPDDMLVKRVQRTIVDGQHLKGQRKLRPEEKGEWRMHDVVIRSSDDITRPPRRIGSRWQDVPADMAAWLALACDLHQRCRKQPAHLTIGEIAHLHWRYERIHPFSDGNGRSGRAMAYYQYLQAGLSPFVFPSRDRGMMYYPSFEQCTSEMMERYFLGRGAVR